MTANYTYQQYVWKSDHYEDDLELVLGEFLVV